MATRDYAWRVETKLDRATLRGMLDLYRPFRIEAHFSNGLSTREFADEVAYPTAEPLAKLLHFESEISIDASTRMLDIGCNLGYYCHYFLERGAQAAVGLEFDARLFSCATLLRAIAGLDSQRLALLHGDFGEQPTQAAAQRHGPYDVILSLASANNIRCLTSALLAVPALLRPGGAFVVEYLAIDSAEPICRFDRGGFRGDRTHYWIFSEPFLDDFLGAAGMEKAVRTLEWSNRDVLGDYKKIFAIYRHRGG